MGLLIIPGPAVIYVVTRSVDQGRRAGLVSVLGLHTGSIVHVVAAATGISALVVASATAFNAVKLAGAAYLIALGVMRLVRGGPKRAEVRPERSSRHIYRQGVVVAVLNPKTAVFFLALLPQFVDRDRGMVVGQTLILGVTFIVLGLLSDSCYALASSAIAPRLRARPDVVERSERWSGLVYIALGCVAAVARRPATSQA
jgi:threonine/homoserine/homoserine lactone efflux protein